MPRITLLLPLTLLALAAIHPPTAPAARACSCIGSDIVAPQNDQVVPDNARVWLKLAGWALNSDSKGTLVIEPATATVREFSDIQLTGDWVLRSFAIDGLAAGQTYTASWSTQYGGEISVRFSVAAAVATDGPAPPRVAQCVEDKEVSTLFGGISSCGEWHKVDIDVQAPGAAVVLALRDGDGELDADAISGKVTAAASFMFEGQMFRTYMGSAPCGPTTWDISKGSTNIRVGSYDITGRFSGWSASNKVVAGCQGGSSPSTPLAMALALAALFALRRRSTMQQRGVAG